MNSVPQNSPFLEVPQEATQAIPALEELKSGKQWICVENDKTPIDPVTGNRVRGKLEEGNPYWGTCEDASCAWRQDKKRFVGIGREFIKHQGYTGIDLDDCVKDGRASPWAQEIIDRFESYTEYSLSGNGVHIWVKGNIETNVGPGADHIEMYDSKRYFVVTGKRYPGTPTMIEERQAELTAFHHSVTFARKNQSIDKMLADECATVAGAREGTRNNTLNIAALKIGHYVPHLLNRDIVEQALLKAALKAGLSRQDALRTIASGLKKGMQEPRHGGTEASPGTFTSAIDMALAAGDKQTLYTLISEIITLTDEQQADLRWAIRAIFGRDFPMREFEGRINVERQKTIWDKKQPRPFSARELMAKKIEPPQWIVDGIIPTGLIALAGKHKIGKSWFALQLALALSFGGKLLGRQLEKMGVLYLALEQPEGPLLERMDVLQRGSGKVPNDLYFETKWPRMDTKGINALEGWLSIHPEIKLVIVDTFVKVRPNIKQGLGKTGYDADYEALEGLKRLADELGICIMPVFHLRKDRGGGEDGDPLDEINATSGVAACVDGVVLLKRGRKEEVGSLYATGRQYPREVDIAIRFCNAEWTILEGSPELYQLTPERKAIIAVLDEQGAMTSKELADALELPYGNVRKMLFVMKDKGQVQESGGKYMSSLPEMAMNEIVFCGNSGNSGNTGNIGNSGNAAWDEHSGNVLDQPVKPPDENECYRCYHTLPRGGNVLEQPGDCSKEALLPCYRKIEGTMQNVSFWGNGPDSLTCEQDDLVDTIDGIGTLSGNTTEDGKKVGVLLDGQEKFYWRNMVVSNAPEKLLDGFLATTKDWDKTATDDEARLLEQLREMGGYPVSKSCPHCGYRVVYDGQHGITCAKCGIDDIPVSEAFKAQVRAYRARK